MSFGRPYKVDSLTTRYHILDPSVKEFPGRLLISRFVTNHEELSRDVQTWEKCSFSVPCVLKRWLFNKWKESHIHQVTCLLLGTKSHRWYCESAATCSRCLKVVSRDTYQLATCPSKGSHRKVLSWSLCGFDSIHSFYADINRYTTH